MLRYCPSSSQDFGHAIKITSFLCLDAVQSDVFALIARCHTSDTAPADGVFSLFVCLFVFYYSEVEVSASSMDASLTEIEIHIWYPG